MIIGNKCDLEWKITEAEIETFKKEKKVSIEIASAKTG